MAIDHFEKHARKSPVDWNFNLVFDNQQSVAELAEHYKATLEHPGLYPPVPSEWLHATILRVGLLEEYTQDEMLAVAEVLQSKVSNLELPEFRFDSWWLWGGNVVFHLSPGEQLAQLYDALESALNEVLGSSRTAKTPHGNFIPHATLAYTRTHDHHSEKEIYDRLMALPAKTTTFSAANISLIKQWPVNGHYEWEVVRQITI